MGKLWLELGKLCLELGKLCSKLEIKQVFALVVLKYSALNERRVNCLKRFFENFFS